MSSRREFLGLAALGATLTATLAACSGGSTPATTVAPSTAAPTTSTTTTSTTSTTTSTTVAPATTTTVPDVLRMPLTGMPIDNAAVIPDRPALAVKIHAEPSAVRPQAGLNHADIVFETIINDSVTRFIAIFHSDGTRADPVGPIRSGRGQDVNLLRMFHQPLMAWSGGNPTVTRQFREAAAAGQLLDLNNARGHSDLYYRRSGRGGSPHNLFSATDTLWTAAPAEFTVPTPVFPYVAPAEAVAGEPAEAIEIELDSTSVRWEFDPASGTYLRWHNGSPHTTEGAGRDTSQVSADNVVVVLADYGVSRFDGNPDMQSLGSNTVHVFSAGTVRSGVWLRFLPEDGFGFVDDLDDLAPIGLVPGRTWVEFPRNQPGTVSIDGAEVTPATTNL